MLLAENQNLKWLVLNGNKITDIGVASLAQDHHLSELQLRDNLMTDMGAYILVRRSIGWLNVSSNQIGCDGINALEDAHHQHRIVYLLDNTILEMRKLICAVS